MRIYKSELGNIFTGKSGKIEKIVQSAGFIPDKSEHIGKTIYRLINEGVSVDQNYSRYLI